MIVDFLGCTSTNVDLDIWLKAETKTSDGSKYYSYILSYVDDVLCIHQYGEGTIMKIDKYFNMKEDSIGDPYIYILGLNLERLSYLIVPLHEY